jgi:hypothetical protein
MKDESSKMKVKAFCLLYFPATAVVLLACFKFALNLSVAWVPTQSVGTGKQPYGLERSDVGQVNYAWREDTRAWCSPAKPGGGYSSSFFSALLAGPLITSP